MSPTTIPGTFILQSPASNDPLLDLNTQPSLDLQFATGKTLDDRVSGLPLVNHQRDASGGKSAGTYVGSDGLIKTSPVNLQPYSEITVNWTTQGSTLSPDFALAPNGTNTAAQIIPFSGIYEGRIFYQSSLTGQLTASCFFKPNGYDFATIGLFKGTDYASIIVNLLTGEVTAVSSGAVPEAYSVTDAGNGWKRLSVTTTTAFSYVSLGSAPDASTTLNTFGLVDAATFDGTSGVLAWGAQLEEGSTASTYIPTTSTISGAPRFDHDPVTGESLGLLIEESRTNLFANSNFAQSTPTSFPTNWSGWNPATFLTSQTLSPDGISFGLFHGGYNSNGGGLRKDLTGLTAGGTYYLTFYVKGLTTSELTYFTNNNAIGTTTGNTSGAQNVPWFAATKVKFNAGSLNGTGASGSAQVALTTEWKKIDSVVTADNAGSVRIIIDNNVGDVGTGDEDGGGTWMIWGAQLEAGSFPTSYIPTTSSAVIRAADVASITGTNFSSWYNQSEGTMFSDVTAYSGDKWRAGLVMDTAIGAATRLQIINQETQDRVYYGGAFQDITPNVLTGQQFKSVWSTDSSSIYATSNGSSVVTLAQAPAQTMNGLGVGSMLGVAGTFGNGHISRLAYYPYRLADATLQEITS